MADPLGIITSVNFLGLGSDPIGIVFAIMITLFVLQEEIRLQKWTNPAIMFILNYMAMFSIGICTQAWLFAVIIVPIGVGVILNLTSKMR